MEILRTENLSFKYAQESTAAVSDISLSVNRGEFFLLCGLSGCGKSTLLRLLKPEIAPSGEKSGRVLINNADIGEFAPSVGFVMQSPEAQIVTDKVWHELAFGLENTGMKTDEIRRKVAEMANFFGIHTWFREKTSNLSGGQKQLLNLAGIMLMEPEILILDEPTAQLDPIASKTFLQAVLQVNRELGTTIILAEHALEEAFAMATKVAVMDSGKILFTGSACNTAKYIISSQNNMQHALPIAVRMAAEINACNDLPITVPDGRNFLLDLFKDKAMPEMDIANCKIREKETVLELKDIWFTYEKEKPPVLRDFSLSVKKGDFFALLGGNASGKTTAIKLLAGSLRAQSGKVKIYGKNITKNKNNKDFNRLAFLPQNPQSLFVYETLLEDLQSVGNKNEVEQIAKYLGIKNLLNRHPFDLSGGEMQKAALAKILLRRPKIILMDEPDKGLDSYAKIFLGNILKSLCEKGITILLVSHDVEFCAAFASRCAMVFDGEIISEDIPRSFFGGNKFYTTTVNRITKGIADGIITAEEGIMLCKKAKDSA